MLKAAAAVSLAASSIWPSSRTFAVYGDSRTEQCHYTDGTGSIEVRGYVYWLELISGGRFRCNVANNFGVAGNTTALALARINAVLADQSPLVIVRLGTNDIGGNLPAETPISNLTTIVQTLRAAGKLVILVNEQPRNFDMTAYKRQQLFKLRRWISTQHNPAGGVYVADPYGRLADRIDANGSPVAAYFSDGLHENATGARLIAESIYYGAMERLYPVNDPLSYNNNDVFDAVENPFGNLILNGQMAGTGGTAGTGITNSAGIADNWAMSRGSAASPWTITTTKYIDPVDGFPWQQIVVSGTATASNPACSFAQNLVLANLVPGADYEAMAEVAVDAGAQNIRSVEVRLAATRADTSLPFWAGGAAKDVNLIPDTAYRGFSRSPPARALAGDTAFQVAIAIRANNLVAAAITARIRNISVRRVA